MEGTKGLKGMLANGYLTTLIFNAYGGQTPYPMKPTCPVAAYITSSHEMNIEHPRSFPCPYRY
jgi:hypothetical protein